MTTFEQHLFEAVARGLRAKQAEHESRVKIVRDEHIFEDARKCSFEVMSPESVMARRNADALGKLATAFEHEVGSETKR